MKLSRIIALVSLGCISLGSYVVYADTLTFDNLADMGNFVPLHFNYKNNDFAGFILMYAPSTLTSSQTVTYANATLVCKKQRDGFYVSFMRGLRILPLNQTRLTSLQNAENFLNYRNLSLQGGLYTDCQQAGVPLNQTKNSTVGALTYTRDGDYGGIYIGGTVDTVNNTISNTFANSLRAIDATTAQGYLYDSMGGGLSQLSYNYTNTIVDDGICTTPPCPPRLPGAKGIGIEGKVGVSKALDVGDKFGLQNEIGQNATVYGVEDVNASLVLRTVSKNTQNLCRGATIYTSLADYISRPKTEKAGVKSICLDNTTSTSSININAQTANDLQSKDIIVRNRDVVLSTDFDTNTRPINLFVDRGNVQIDSNTGILQSFDAQGGVATSTNGVTKGGYIKGNIFINGLMLGKNNAPVSNKVYIHGKFTSLNLPGTSVSQGRQEQIQQLFSNLESQEQTILAIYKSFISLQNVFTWACDPLTNSGTVSTNNNISCADTTNIYRNKSLIIIDTPYVTNLLTK